MDCCEGIHVRKFVHRVGGRQAGMQCGPTVIVCQCGGAGHQPDPKAELRDLEEYQRDLEQEVADVADRIKELRKSTEQEGDA